jgi:chromosome segregation ATPase
MRNRAWLLLVLPVAAACGDGHHWRTVLRDYARPDTVERLHAVLDGERARGDTSRRQNRVLREKNEYLLGELTALSSIVNEIDRDLSGGHAGGSIQPLLPNGEVGDTVNERQLLEAKRQRIAANLDRLTSQLQRSDSLWRAATASDKSAREALASSAETLAMFRTLAETRAAQFAEFEQRVDSLKLENRALSNERDRMRDSLTRLSSRIGRVFYVVGTREELLAAGVIREVTVAKKNWRGWQREKQLLPSREAELSRLATIRSAFGSIATTASDDESDVEQQGSVHAPDNGEFRELDRYRDTVLALPPLRHARLRVLSAQDMRFAEGVGRDGRVNADDNRLRISDPESFWEGGRYLIVLVEP